MTDPEDLRAKLRRKSKESAQRTDDLLEDELAALGRVTKQDLTKLTPKLTAACDELIDALNQSTRKNESIAELRERLSKLGPAAATLGKAVIKLISS